MKVKPRFSFFGDAREYRKEFIRFPKQGRHFTGGNRPAVNQKLEPVAGFFKLLERIAQLRNEFAVGACSETFPVVGPNGRART
jgi:hypothetical protein